jgi:hypothetical protein
MVHKKWAEVIHEWEALFENFISNIRGILQEDEDWDTIEDVQEFLSEQEKQLLEKNNLHFNLPEGIGDAYDLRSQVQNLIQDEKWID